MGLAVAPNDCSTAKGSSTRSNAANIPERRHPKSSRKGWTLFILKQNASCEPENSPVEENMKEPSYQCHGCGNEHDSNCILTSPPVNNRSSTGDATLVPLHRKERIRGLASIVQDVLSRSKSDLRRGYGPRNSEEDGMTGVVVGHKDSAPEMSLSFRMRLVDRCDTDLGVAASLRSGSQHSAACESIRSCRYPLQWPGEGASIVGVIHAPSESSAPKSMGQMHPSRDFPEYDFRRNIAVQRQAPSKSFSASESRVSESSREKLQLQIENLLITSEIRLSAIALRNRQRLTDDLLERGKRMGIEDNPRVLSSRSSTTDEYECVVKRLRDGRGTIRLLAATAVREATRNSPQAREDLWRAGAIPPLVNLLQEDDMGICYMATVALLNLAIGSIRNKQDMADCGAVPILVRLMRPESTTTVRESATTVILSLAASDQLKPCIGSSGAVIYLSDILTNGTTQGRSDAVRALLNLSIFKGNRPVIVRAGVISPLYKVILRDAKETAEKAVILLSHLFHDREGRETITAEEYTCTVLIQVLKRGTFSQTCKEQMVVILLSLSAKMAVRREAVFAQGILPSLVEIALIGSSPKIQEKATKLLRIIKEQRMDEGILSMDRLDRISIDLDDELPVDRQYSSSSTVGTSTSTIPSSRRRVDRSVSSISEKEEHLSNKEAKEVKNLNYFRSLLARTIRSEYLHCRAVSIDDSSRVPVKFIRSFCSQG